MCWNWLLGLVSLCMKKVCVGLVTCVCFWGCPVNREISSFVRRQSSGVLDLVICVWFWCGGGWDGWLAGLLGDVWLAIGRGVAGHRERCGLAIGAVWLAIGVCVAGYRGVWLAIWGVWGWPWGGMCGWL